MMRFKFSRILSFSFLTLLLFSACTSNEDYLPKERGFSYIEIPKHSYTPFNDSILPYSFEISNYAQALKDTNSFKERKEAYRILNYPTLNCQVYLTYKPINNNTETLYSLIAEGFDLRDGHNKKAYGIDEEPGFTQKGYPRTYFNLEGDVPSQFQFMVHDSTTHFMRGALYFPVATKNDSLAPVIEYVTEDIKHLVNTLEWK